MPSMRSGGVLLAAGLLAAFLVGGSPWHGPTACPCAGGLAYAEEIPVRRLAERWEGAPAGGLAGTIVFPKPRPAQPVVVYLMREGGELAYAPPEEKPVVRQREARFDPAFLAIVAGQTVVFDNDEDKEIDHNVYVLGAEERDLGIFGPGTQVPHRFDKAGEVLVHCSIHKLMDGKLFVAPSPAFAVVAPDADAFTIDKVPAGRYVLRTYQKSKRFHDADVPVEIRPGETTTLRVELAR